MSRKELFIQFTAGAFRKLLSIFVFCFSLLALRAGCEIWLYQFLITAYHFTFFDPDQQLLLFQKNQISMMLIRRWPYIWLFSPEHGNTTFTSRLLCTRDKWNIYRCVSNTCIGIFQIHPHCFTFSSTVRNDIGSHNIIISCTNRNVEETTYCLLFYYGLFSFWTLQTLTYLFKHW